MLGRDGEQKNKGGESFLPNLKFRIAWGHHGIISNIKNVIYIPLPSNLNLEVRISANLTTQLIHTTSLLKQEYYMPIKLSIYVKRDFRGYSSSGIGSKIENFRCYGYGATRRSGETSLAESFNTENSASLFSDNVDLINVEEWFLQTDYAIKSATGKVKTQLVKQFAQIKEVLKRILPDSASCLHEHVLSSLFHDRSPDFPAFAPGSGTQPIFQGY